ncbi:MAG: hypothetical protein ACYDCC_02395 [Actinomycetota bacterium]
MNIEIVRGNPTPTEVAAIEAAFRKVNAKPMKNLSEWVARSRLAATRNDSWWNRSWVASLR